MDEAADYEGQKSAGGGDRRMKGRGADLKEISGSVSWRYSEISEQQAPVESLGPKVAERRQERGKGYENLALYGAPSPSQ